MSIKMRFVALGVASALVLALWFAAVYHPASAKLGKLKQDVAASQSQEAQLRSELVRLEGLKKDAPHLRAQAEKFTAALPSDPAVSKFIRLVQDAANQAHIDFLSIGPSLPTAVQAPASAATAPTVAGSSAATPAPSATPQASTPPATVVAPPTTSSLQSITIALTAKGSFFPMKDFIHRLEHLQRALRVTTFSVQGGGGTGVPAGGLSVSLSLSVFTAPATVAAGPSVSTPVSTPAPGNS